MGMRAMNVLPRVTERPVRPPQAPGPGHRNQPSNRGVAWQKTPMINPPRPPGSPGPGRAAIPMILSLCGSAWV
eukprot:131414-Hanusia_phi.AAC.6